MLRFSASLKIVPSSSSSPYVTSRSGQTYLFLFQQQQQQHQRVYPSFPNKRSTIPIPKNESSSSSCSKMLKKHQLDNHRESMKLSKELTNLLTQSSRLADLAQQQQHETQKTATSPPEKPALVCSFDQWHRAFSLLAEGLLLRNEEDLRSNNNNNNYNNNTVSTLHFNLALAIASKCKQWKAMQHCEAQMAVSGIRADCHTLNVFMASSLITGDWLNALDLFESALGDLPSQSSSSSSSSKHELHINHQSIKVALKAAVEGSSGSSSTTANYQNYTHHGHRVAQKNRANHYFFTPCWRVALTLYKMFPDVIDKDTSMLSLLVRAAMTRAELDRQLLQNWETAWRGKATPDSQTLMNLSSVAERSVSWSLALELAAGAAAVSAPAAVLSSLFASALKTSHRARQDLAVLTTFQQLALHTCCTRICSTLPHSPATSAEQQQQHPQQLLVSLLDESAFGATALSCARLGKLSELLLVRDQAARVLGYVPSGIYIAILKLLDHHFRRHRQQQHQQQQQNRNQNQNPETSTTTTTSGEEILAKQKFILQDMMLQLSTNSSTTSIEQKLCEQVRLVEAGATTWEQALRQLSTITREPDSICFAVAAEIAAFSSATQATRTTTTTTTTTTNWEAALMILNCASSSSSSSLSSISSQPLLATSASTLLATVLIHHQNQQHQIQSQSQVWQASQSTKISSFNRNDVTALSIALQLCLKMNFDDGPVFREALNQVLLSSSSSSISHQKLLAADETEVGKKEEEKGDDEENELHSKYSNSAGRHPRIRSTSFDFSPSSSFFVVPTTTHSEKLLSSMLSTLMKIDQLVVSTSSDCLSTETDSLDEQQQQQQQHEETRLRLLDEIIDNVVQMSTLENEGFQERNNSSATKIVLTSLFRKLFSQLLLVAPSSPPSNNSNKRFGEFATIIFDECLSSLEIINQTSRASTINVSLSSDEDFSGWLDEDSLKEYLAAHHRRRRQNSEHDEYRDDDAIKRILRIARIISSFGLNSTLNKEYRLPPRLATTLLRFIEHHVAVVAAAFGASAGAGAGAGAAPELQQQQQQQQQKKIHSPVSTVSYWRSESLDLFNHLLSKESMADVENILSVAKVCAIAGDDATAIQLLCDKRRKFFVPKSSYLGNDQYSNSDQQRQFFEAISNKFAASSSTTRHPKLVAAITNFFGKSLPRKQRVNLLQHQWALEMTRNNSSNSYSNNNKNKYNNPNNGNLVSRKACEKTKDNGSNNNSGNHNVVPIDSHKIGLDNANEGDDVMELCFAHLRAAPETLTTRALMIVVERINSFGVVSPATRNALLIEFLSSVQAADLSGKLTGRTALAVVSSFLSNNNNYNNNNNNNINSNIRKSSPVHSLEQVDKVFQQLLRQAAMEGMRIVGDAVWKGATAVWLVRICEQVLASPSSSSSCASFSLGDSDVENDKKRTFRSLKKLFDQATSLFERVNCQFDISDSRKFSDYENRSENNNNSSNNNNNNNNNNTNELFPFFPLLSEALRGISDEVVFAALSSSGSSSTSADHQRQLQRQSTNREVIILECCTTVALASLSWSLPTEPANAEAEQDDDEEGGGNYNDHRRVDNADQGNLLDSFGIGNFGCHLHHHHHHRHDGGFPCVVSTSSSTQRRTSSSDSLSDSPSSFLWKKAAISWILGEVAKSSDVDPQQGRREERVDDEEKFKVRLLTGPHATAATTPTTTTPTSTTLSNQVDDGDDDAAVEVDTDESKATSMNEKTPTADAIIRAIIKNHCEQKMTNSRILVESLFQELTTKCDQCKNNIDVLEMILVKFIHPFSRKVLASNRFHELLSPISILMSVAAEEVSKALWNESRKTVKSASILRPQDRSILALLFGNNNRRSSNSNNHQQSLNYNDIDKQVAAFLLHQENEEIAKLAVLPIVLYFLEQTRPEEEQQQGEEKNRKTNALTLQNDPTSHYSLTSSACLQLAARNKAWSVMEIVPATTTTCSRSSSASPSPEMSEGLESALWEFVVANNNNSNYNNSHNNNSKLAKQKTRTAFDRSGKADVSFVQQLLNRHRRTSHDFAFVFGLQLIEEGLRLCENDEDEIVIERARWILSRILRSTRQDDKDGDDDDQVSFSPRFQPILDAFLLKHAASLVVHLLPCADHDDAAVRQQQETDYFIFREKLRRELIRVCSVEPSTTASPAAKTKPSSASLYFLSPYLQGSTMDLRRRSEDATKYVQRRGSLRATPSLSSSSSSSSIKRSKIRLISNSETNKTKESAENNAQVSRSSEQLFIVNKMERWIFSWDILSLRRPSRSQNDENEKSAFFSLTDVVLPELVEFDNFIVSLRETNNETKSLLARRRRLPLSAGALHYFVDVWEKEHENYSLIVRFLCEISKFADGDYDDDKSEEKIVSETCVPKLVRTRFNILMERFLKSVPRLSSSSAASSTSPTSSIMTLTCEQMTSIAKLFVAVNRQSKTSSPNVGVVLVNDCESEDEEELFVSCLKTLVKMSSSVGDTGGLTKCLQLIAAMKNKLEYSVIRERILNQYLPVACCLKEAGGANESDENVSANQQNRSFVRDPVAAVIVESRRALLSSENFSSSTSFVNALVEKKIEQIFPVVRSFLLSSTASYPSTCAPLQLDFINQLCSEIQSKSSTSTPRDRQRHQHSTNATTRANYRRIEEVPATWQRVLHLISTLRQQPEEKKINNDNDHNNDNHNDAATIIRILQKDASKKLFDAAPWVEASIALATIIECSSSSCFSSSSSSSSSPSLSSLQNEDITKCEFPDQNRDKGDFRRQQRCEYFFSVIRRHLWRVERRTPLPSVVKHQAAAVAKFALQLQHEKQHARPFVSGNDNNKIIRSQPLLYELMRLTSSSSSSSTCGSLPIEIFLHLLENDSSSSSSSSSEPMMTILEPLNSALEAALSSSTSSQVSLEQNKLSKKDFCEFVARKFLRSTNSVAMKTASGKQYHERQQREDDRQRKKFISMISSSPISTELLEKVLARFGSMCN